MLLAVEESSVNEKIDTRLIKNIEKMMKIMIRKPINCLFIAILKVTSLKKCYKKNMVLIWEGNIMFLPQSRPSNICKIYAIYAKYMQYILKIIFPRFLKIVLDFQQ